MTNNCFMVLHIVLLQYPVCVEYIEIIASLEQWHEGVFVDSTTHYESLLYPIIFTVIQ